MDHTSLSDTGFCVDLESGLLTSDEELGSKAGSKRSEKRCGNVSSSSEVSPESVKVGEEAATGLSDKTSVKEKRKKTSNKKPPRPPRPPRGPSLDAADQKLVREISELAMLKRARIERMRALKKMKATKSSTSSNSSLLAMVFTVLFCLVILFHGMSCGNSPESFQGSSVSSGSNEGGLISVQFYPIPSAVIPNGAGSESPNMVEQVSGSDPQEKVTRYAG